jgi:Tfp pilus assembly protein PilF
MSLLIKALDKAESDKVEHASGKQKLAEKSKAKIESAEDIELTLSPADSILDELAPVAKSSDVTTQSAILSNPNRVASAPSASSNSPKSAANVFSAKGAGAVSGNKALALIAGASLIALLAMGLYYYQFVMSVPDVVVPPRSLAQMQESVQEQVQEQLPEQLADPLPETSGAETAMPPAFVPETQMAENSTTKKMVKQPAVSEDEEFAEDEALVDETVTAKANKKGSQSKNSRSDEAIASRSASIEVTRTQSAAAAVNPTLMSAYQAYIAGNDTDAQKLYKQVLQRDIHNVDALLGLGAIATRQGRDADANGWYRKVLEVDPRNNIAQAALLESQPQGSEANSESRLKNMLVKNPSDANLHVSLGNLYAEQNQWPAAQQAYFDAFSLNGSADNAFNLAVSLDQMGKPKLALPYYQRASELAQIQANSIDKVALEARIAAIQ